MLAAFEEESGSQVERKRLIVQGASAGAAVLLHIGVVVLLGYSISFTFSEVEPVHEPQIIVMAERFIPPPPIAGESAAEDMKFILPRFRPRQPAFVRPMPKGNPATALWQYLCNRDLNLSAATQVACPTPSFGDVGLDVLQPLNRRGDAGIMFGADTSTMSLDEAGVAKGWTKAKPKRGQTAVGSVSDQTAPSAAPELYKDLPGLKPPTESLPGYE